MKEGGTWEGKRSGGREKANKKRRNGERYFPRALFCRKEPNEAFKLIFTFLGMHLHAIRFSFAFWHQTYIPVALSGLNQ